MLVLQGKETSFIFGIWTTGFTVSYRILSRTGTVIQNWSTSGVFELGFGKYAVRATINSLDAAYVHFKGVKTGEEDENLFDPITVIADYTQDISKILQSELGDWEILDNQMIKYESDGETPLVAFDLFNKLGEPAEINVVKRTVV